VLRCTDQARTSRFPGCAGDSRDRIRRVGIFRADRLQAARCLLIGHTWVLWCWNRGGGPAHGTEDAQIAANGAILQMFNHGLSALGCSSSSGPVRRTTRATWRLWGLFRWCDLRRNPDLHIDGIARTAGTECFVSEFLVVRGTYPILTIWTAISMIGLLFTGAYILKASSWCCTGR